MDGIFAVTDPNWLLAIAANGGGEANFWQPSPTRVRVEPGTPWIFKVRGQPLVGGFGFFSYWTEMPLSLAWETFRLANGVDSFSELLRRVRRLRDGGTTGDDDRVGCVVLSDTVVLPVERYVPAPRDWKPNIVRIAGYDISSGEGGAVWDRLRALDPNPVLDLKRAASPLFVRGGYTEPQLVAARRGQGAFRFMVIDAYDRRCAVTGEHTLPVLEAAHIRPFAEHARHEVRNGLLLRSDLHRLYDRGLVTVRPDLTFDVSPTIDRDYRNGKIYYELAGKTIRVPKTQEQRPDEAGLEWHASNVFRA